jgi:hypothetical protein
MFSATSDQRFVEAFSGLLQRWSNIISQTKNEKEGAWVRLKSYKRKLD